VGRKILATGNGRCNLSNVEISENNYHGKNPGFVKEALDFFGVQRTLAWFREIGLVCKTEEGRVYPACGQAAAVLDVLRNEAARLGVRVMTGQAVKKIEKSGDGFKIYCKQNEALTAGRVIVSAGGLASPFSAPDGSVSGLDLMKRLGHRVREPFPALAGIKSGSPYMKALKGVRVDGRIGLEAGGRHEERVGEIQFTGEGVSGIPAMDLSGLLYDGDGKIYRDAAIGIDFAPEMELRELAEYLSERKQRLHDLDMERFLIGFVHKAAGAALVKAAGFDLRMPVGHLSEKTLLNFAGMIKNFTLPVSGTNGFREAQVMGGGLLTEEFAPESMESRLVPGLYACGEILDIFGDCGGYNLQWAWSSGQLAGSRAASR